MGKSHNLRIFLLAFCASCFSTVAFSQGLEDIIVETYYISDANDATDGDGGSLVEGSTTYRIYVDMAAGYEIQAVFGNTNHPMSIATSTEFFNNEDRGAETGDGIGLNRFDDNTVAVDSYVTLGAPTGGTLGVLKSEDTDGAIANGDGFLQSVNPLAGIPISVQDGMIDGALPSSVITVGLDLSMFADANDATPFSANGGAWSVLEGVTGPTAQNRVLIAQITTNGDLTFALNVQLGAPGGATEQYVAETNAADTDQQFFAGLTFPQAPVAGCTSSSACNYDLAANSDDGSCIEPVVGCAACNATNDGLVIVDADADGVCDADEIAGCTNATACNFDSSATDEDGSCIEPVAGCQACNATNDGLVIVDADGDGVCDANEVPGCTDSAACNYDGAATDENGSCIVPVADCSACNATNDGLDIIDADGDGVCDANEVPGCTNVAACNYDVTADSDDGSCIVPVADCSACNPTNDGLEIIDTDGDGICNAEEIPGCTDSAAGNFNPSATDEDGSCTFGSVFACDGVEGGLEDIIVETYYIADANDASDTDGGGDLVEGATTYRVYVDLAPGYEIQAVYGNAAHPMSIGTTTEFFNNEDRGEETGDAISFGRFDDNTVALDSYVTLGAPTDATAGVLKSEDSDGAITNGAGFLQNTDAAAGIPVSVQDGMIPGTLPSGVVAIGLDLSMFADANSATQFFANGGAWSVLEGVTGPTATNRVLIAQITTDGDFSFELNVQVGAPDGSVEQYVARDASGAERQCAQLVYPGTPGCIDVSACNFNVNATFDDASCIFPVVDCSACNATNDGVDFIDADGDGVCNADETPGCSSPTACNYDSTVDTVNDDGSCIEPVVDCSACNATNDGLIIIDADGDGVCDAAEVLGCTSSAACNYNVAATNDDASCIEPVTNCSECNATNDGLDLIDSDGDGVCDAQESPGCTSSTACNYDVNASNDDGTCIEPIAGCSQCDNGALVIVDADGDGICDAEEIFGCTDANACNYDVTATEEDASCIIPVDGCTVCNAANDGLEIVDLNGNGICDAEEQGCNDELACNYQPGTPGAADCVYSVTDCSICNPAYYVGYTGDLTLIVDTDGDGICDGEEIFGCTSVTACNFNPLATETFPEECIETIPGCYACNAMNDGLDLIDTDLDGVCDGEEIPGCQSATACNYNPNATDDNGSCFEPIPSCLECGANGGVVLIDTDNDGICDAEEVLGCSTPGSCNYNPLATDDDGSCLEPISNCYVCNGTDLEIVDADGDGICNAYEIAGCQSETACNYDSEATDDNGSCLEPVEDCLECFFLNMHWLLVSIDTDFDGICDADEIPGCTSATACNYEPSATDEDGSCIEPVADCSACNTTNDGLVIIDTDGDGVCDAEEILGCTSLSACNYNPTATEENGMCLEPSADCEVCFFDGMHWQLVLVDSDGDGVCNADDICFGDDATGDADGDGICADEEIYGCTSATACNYDVAATEDDWSCLEPAANCVVCNANNTGLVLVDIDGDGVCDANEIPGCTSATACNYDDTATDNDGSCIEPVANCSACNGTNDGLVIIDTDGDGVCNADEIYGCTSVTACNYYTAATEDDWSCLEPLANCLVCNATNTGLILVDADGDGVCNASEITGCDSPSACNYDAAATDNDGSCIEPTYGCTECDPILGILQLVDTDGDGICDADEISGCASATACNFNADATDDNGSCIEPVPNCTACYTTQGGIVFLIQVDADNDGICNADEIPGCTTEGATNYDPTATDDDGTCTFDCADVGDCESFEGGFNGWANASSDDIDWTLFSGATPSFYTGPNAAYDGSEYVYIEASFPNYPNKNAQLVSPCFELTASSSISFAYHMQGVYNAVGALSVDISIDNGASWASVWDALGHQGTAWNQAVVDISAFTGETVRFRLSGTTANSWKGDIAVDNFCVVESVLGCTNPDSSNFDPAATVDDGSCTDFTCNGTISNFPYCESFENGFGIWAQTGTDDFDWTLNSGGTASWGTGPDAANDGVNYIYAESSHPNYPFKNAIINTPCFDLTVATAPVINFDYSMLGSFVGSIYVQASTDGLSWSYLWWETGNQGAAWQSASVDLSAYAGQSVQLRFIGQTAHGWQGDLALDNVCVTSGLAPETTPDFSSFTQESIGRLATKQYDGVQPLQTPEFAETAFIIYPNPATSSSDVQIQITDIEEGVNTAQITILDLMGKEIVATQMNVNGSSASEYLDLPFDVANGTYIVMVTAGQSIMTQKLVISK